MDRFPAFMSIPDDQQPDEPSNVHTFPRVVFAQEKVRRTRRLLQRCEDSIANDDPRSDSIEERVRLGASISMLPEWKSQLRAAEAELTMLEATDTITFRGRIYHATLGSAGAH